MAVRSLTDATFDEVVGSAPVPVLVDFWAEWCGPCRLVLPVLDQLAVEMADRLVVAKVNVDENPELLARHDITTMPTLKLFVDGRLVHTILGAKPRGQLLESLAPHLSGGA